MTTSSRTAPEAGLVRAKAPLRISFCGGGTDVPPYPERYGGCVLSCTIDKYSYVTLRRRADDDVVIRSRDFGVSVRYDRGHVRPRRPPRARARDRRALRRARRRRVRAQRRAAGQRARLVVVDDRRAGGGVRAVVGHDAARDELARARGRDRAHRPRDRRADCRISTPRRSAASTSCEFTAEGVDVTPLALAAGDARRAALPPVAVLYRRHAAVIAHRRRARRAASSAPIPRSSTRSRSSSR